MFDGTSMGRTMNPSRDWHFAFHLHENGNGNDHEHFSG